jgi:protoporphyrinogen oxidase
MNPEGLVVLGAGVAGLAASIYSGAGIYEGGDSVGGVAQSDTVDGFTFDRGIHILQTRNKLILDLLSDVGVEFTAHSRNAYIYSHGKYTAYPFQVNTAGLSLSLRMKCVWGFLRRGCFAEPSNYEEWIYRSVGKGFAETFLIPYSEKFWTVSPREMTHEWTGNRVPQPTTLQVLRGALVEKQTRIGTNFDFQYPNTRDGYGTIANALLKRTGPLHLNHKAVRVDSASQVVSFQNGHTAQYETLISTIPLPDLIAICPQAPGAVRKAASLLWCNSIFVVNLGIDRSDISSKHWVHFPERDLSFFRISYPHTFSNYTAPPGMSSISAEVAYSEHRPLDRNSIVPRVVDDLRRVGALGRNDRIVAQATRDIPSAYCVYDHNRKQALNTVFSWLDSVNIVPCGRYGRWTYFWSDESMLSGKKAAELAIKRRGPSPQMVD